jgi:hypothetical protein
MKITINMTVILDSFKHIILKNVSVSIIRKRLLLNWALKLYGHVYHYTSSSETLRLMRIMVRGRGLQLHVGGICYITLVDMKV